MPLPVAVMQFSRKAVISERVDTLDPQEDQI